MEIGEISSRYARALFSLAEEKHLETQIYENMKMLVESFHEHAALAEVLDNPLISEKEKMSLLITAGGGKEEESNLYRKFILLVLRHRREEFILFMAHGFIELYRRKKRITRVVFSAPVKIDPKTEIHLKAKLREETGDTIEFFGVVKPELIGGFSLMIRNLRIDASYSTGLRDIREELLNNK